MSEENKESRVYNLLISKGIDSYNEYEFYKERINSQKDYGLYHDNKEICDDLINKSKELKIPLLFVRSFGVEYVLEEIVENADAVVGWNPHCIIDAIQTLVKGEEEWIKPCDIEDES